MNLIETLPPEVAVVRQQFEDWRAQRTQKGPLPQHLWQAAAGLLPRYPIALVAHACRLNPSKLKQIAIGQTQKTPATKAFRTVTTEALQQAAGLPLRPVTEIRFALTRCGCTAIFRCLGVQKINQAILFKRSSVKDVVLGLWL